MPDDLAERLQRLELIEQARAAQARYAEVIDRWDIDGLAEVFAPDAVLTAPGRRFDGLQAIQGFYRSVVAADPSRRRHFITNVAVVDADDHQVTLAAAFIYVTGTGGLSIIGWGRYVDTFTLVDGQIWITAKDITVDHRGPVEATWGETLSR